MNKRDFFTLVGFLLFITGFVALALSLVGIKLVLLAWLDHISPLLGFLVKIGMIVVGLIIVVLAQQSVYRPEDTPEEL